ncbi:hypothetical protein G114_13223 [Aeromonas diversa CDC 2478-85]|uniref:Uncharacterized protein n=1 Tax=Aeromonas diversa CDC 2478-85 TaxID=1268237 RepID=N9VIF3_9GAMM|nr:hypothetical protein [Aeromonas diversa]ENY71403.1 hypothetical protein G114_13223 [Aeromonas diversa CDC 2478-85]
MLISPTRQSGITESSRLHPSQEGVLSSRKSARQGRAEGRIDASRLERWSLMGRTQMSVARAQDSEKALGQTWNELKRLERQLAQGKGEQQELQHRLQRLESKLQSGGMLTPELKPKMLQPASTRQVRYGTEPLDLLSAKPTAERLRFSFPLSGGVAEVHIPAGAQGEAVVKRLDQALKHEQIRARMSGKGSLELSIPEPLRRKLDEPVLVTGEGVRVPAGNPIPLRFKAAKGELGELQEGLGKGDIAQEQNRIKRLLSEIEQSMRELKQYRQRMVAQLGQVRAKAQGLNERELESLQQELTGALRQGGFAGTMSGLLAQANVSRQTVVALLT